MISDKQLEEDLEIFPDTGEPTEVPKSYIHRLLLEIKELRNRPEMCQHNLCRNGVCVNCGKRVW